ncbi:MAG: DUF4386 domain-containing protein [Acidimicrobiales bacterium]
MLADKTTAKIVGLLFIAATAAAALSQVVLGSPLDDADYLTNLAADEATVRIGAVLDLVTAAAVVAIPVMLYPILKRHDDTVAVGYLIARALEAVVIVVGAIGLLTLLALSQDLVATAPTDSSSFETIGSMLLASRDLTDALGTQLIFSLTAFILNYSLYQTRLVPRFISIWGLVGAPLMLAAGLLGLFGRDPFSTTLVALALPLAINEMVLALWLIIRGFNPAPTGSNASRGPVTV